READKTHGSVIDWRPEKKQCWAGKVMNILSKKDNPPKLFDKAPPDYDETHLARVPIELAPGQTLLTGEGVWDPNDVPPESDWHRKTAGALRPQVWKISYLTVVDEIPPQHSFRPPYIGGSTKKMADGGTRFWHRNDFLPRMSALPKLAPVTGANPALAYTTVEMPVWWGWGWTSGEIPNGWFVAYNAPWYNTAWYGRDRVAEVGFAGLHTCFDYPDAVKEPIVY